MEKPNNRYRGTAFPTVLAFLILFIIRVNGDEEKKSIDSLVGCLNKAGIRNFTTTVGSQSYERILKYSLQNLRFQLPENRQPAIIILPENTDDVSKAVQCSVKNGFLIRVRCGGHSTEGHSYTAPESQEQRFAMVDLMRMDAVQVDLATSTAWVEGGARLGQLYSAIAGASQTHAFPAGTCPTVGAGGHISGGGFGFLARAHGLAADNVLDAVLVNASGAVLRRQHMGEDVFWALCGGGGGSWGVVAKWKLRLVRIPPRVTACNVLRTGRGHVSETLATFQRSVPAAEKDFFMRVKFSGIVQPNGGRDIQALFQGLYLGSKHQLQERVAALLPELQLKPDECNEIPWIESVALLSDLPHPDLNTLTNTYFPEKARFKVKADIVRHGNELSRENLTGLFNILEQEPSADIIFAPLGGAIAEKPSNAIPFPHRAGNAFAVEYTAAWDDSSRDEYYLDWLRKLYAYMTPFASHDPRVGYINYLDFELGYSPDETQTVEQARQWGYRYFLHNYDRLVQAKTKADPCNVFKNPQSIPPRTTSSCSN